MPSAALSLLGLAGLHQQQVLRESFQIALNSPQCKHWHTTLRSAAVTTMPAVCCFGQAQTLFQLTQIHGE